MQDNHQRRVSVVSVETSQNTIDLMVGARVRMRRLALGISVDEFAVLLGVSSSEVAMFEDGSERVGAPRLLQLSQLLSVPVGWFFERLRLEVSVKMGGMLPSPMDVTACSIESSNREHLLFHFDRIASEHSQRILVSLAGQLADLEASLWGGQDAN